MLFIFIILGKQLLAIAEHVDPGMTKWRGQLLFEMQAATVVLAQRALEEGKLTRFQAQVILVMCVNLILITNLTS